MPHFRDWDKSSHCQIPVHMIAGTRMGGLVGDPYTVEPLVAACGDVEASVRSVANALGKNGTTDVVEPYATKDRAFFSQKADAIQRQT